MIHTIKIPNWHPAKINNDKGHWSAFYRLKKADKKMLSVYCRNIPKATTKRLVGLSIFIKGAGRTPDPDAYWKSLLDALVHCKMLVDDGTKWVETKTPEFIRCDRKETLIMLEDVV